MGFFVMMVLLLLLFASAPAWPHARGWGAYRYYPAGGIGLLLLAWLVLLMLAVVPWWGYPADPYIP